MRHSFKNFKKLTVLICVLTFLCNLESIGAASNDSIRQNITLKTFSNVRNSARTLNDTSQGANNKNGDDNWNDDTGDDDGGDVNFFGADKCKKTRKLSYRFALSSIVMCSVSTSVCTNLFTVELCAIFAPVCAAMLISFGIYMHKFNYCCNHLSKNSSDGVTSGRLWDNSSCSQCMSKDDIISDICNK